MGKKYKEEKIIDSLEKGIKNMQILYDNDVVKIYGKTIKTNKKYYDVITEYLLKHLYLFSNEYITKIYRNPPYIQEKHIQLTDEERAFVFKKQREEEWFARSICYLEFDYIGKTIDYQTPIGDKNAGAIDLLAYNENKKLLSLIELKRENSKETLLRAILEICTYFLQIDRDKLKKELIERKICSDIEDIKKIVLIFKDSFLHKQYKDSDLIKKLANELKVDVCVIDNNYKITHLPEVVVLDGKFDVS